jgi:hypothetical protein
MTRTRTRQYRTPAEWVLVAECLVEEYGAIPSHSWILDNELTALTACMRKHPELFTHTPQKRKNKTPSEWVVIAEELAREHGGLPHGSWLFMNNLGGLAGCVRNHPTFFAHIRQIKKTRTPTEWVALAEQLATEHGGLPIRQWFITNGLGGFIECLRKYPERFAHIPQKKGKRTPQEWLPIAEGLANEHGGLPNSRWLRMHGYTPLYACTRNHPKLFAHLPAQYVE